MRTLKLSAVALALALVGAVYAAGAMQGATRKTQEAAQPAKNCCQKHDGNRAAAHDSAMHEGKGCCTRSGGCCGDACSKEHHKGGHAVAQKSAAGDEQAASKHSCCGAGGACGKAHADTKTEAAAGPGRESCCEDGAACCHGNGQECCKAHKADARKVAAQTNAATDGEAACCSGPCACCADKAARKTHAEGR